MVQGKKRKPKAAEEEQKLKKQTLRKRKKVLRLRKRRNLKMILIVLVLWCVVVLGLVLGGYLWYCYKTLPAFSTAEYVERQTGVRILAEDGRELTSYGALFAEPVDVNELPSYVAQAVIDTEDRRFYKHSGIDYIGFVRAMAVNLVKRRYAQGASTLTQQVAKNLFLTREKSIKRKVQEFILARWLEKHFTKKQILNIYMNRVFFGNGAYGINAAAKRFFNKKAKELNLREAAILAGALKGPSKYNYLKNKKLAIERSEVVLSLMRRAGSISLQEWEHALVLPIGSAFDKNIPDIRYFGDFVMSELPHLANIQGQDVYVRTTLDYDLQKRTEYLLRKHIRANKDKNVTQGAVVVLDKNGAIKAMAGGYDYNKSQFNRATQALRQAGSSFKLFVYLTALEKGIKPEDILNDEPIRIDDWEPQNYDKRFYGKVSMKEAFAKSLNVATVDLATYLDMNDIIETAVKMGVTSGVQDEPSMLLGATEVKVVDMAAAYAAVANGGYAVFPFAVRQIKGARGSILYQHRLSDKIKVISEKALANIDLLLRQVVLTGTGKKAGRVNEARGKTGTSQNYRDAWFIGFNKRYIAAVWVGNDDNSPMREVGGGSVPTEIWADIMR
ncbi:MAG: PBP1A family penicillin-binding protein [Acetobacter sp.]|nr:PBP1A family penicillin-binding protein [Acetobacter sp.]